MMVTLRSFSKINLGLAIGPPRPDGFHALATVYQTIGAYDRVTIAAERSSARRLTLTSNDARVPADERNTAWKAVSWALEAMEVTADVAIHIEKRLPVQGGLGAGSANAAAALLGLERALGVSLPEQERLRIAGRVGSDVPLFLLGGAVLGLGRGEEVQPLDDLAPLPCVIAVPEVGISTPAAFRAWDARNGKLTPGVLQGRLERLSQSVSAAWSQPRSSGVSRGIPPEPAGNLHAGFAADAPTRGDLAETPLLALVRTGIANDFEEVVFSEHPSLADILRLLREPGPGDVAVYAALSGSGSALFGLYADAGAADRAAGLLRKRGIVALRTETLPREQYWRTMWEETR